jgi:hypothetical protein
MERRLLHSGTSKRLSVTEFNYYVRLKGRAREYVTTANWRLP